MFIKTMKQCLPYLIKAKVSAFLWGPHGIGKSESPKQFAEENGYHFVYLNPGTQDVGDLLGLAEFEKDAQGRSVATKFMNPDWLVETINFCKNNPDKYAIIMVDELNRARRDVIQALFPLVLEGRMHTTKLPNNCYVMAAGNPNTEDYIVTDISDKAFISRFCHIRMQPSAAEWFEHAEATGTPAEIINFLKEQTDLLQSATEEFSMDDIKPNRRAWKAIGRLYDTKIPLNLLQELCFGMVGHAATVAFMESLKNTDKPLTAEDVLKKFDKVEEKLKKWSNMETGGRTDLVKVTAENVVNYVKKKEVKLSKTEEKNLVAFLKTIPVETSFNLSRTLFVEEKLMKLLSDDKELIEIYKKAKKL
jgi:MoxR-like ATPase